MRVGVNLVPQNYSDWGRHERGDWNVSPSVPDWKILEDEIAFASLLEPLGFQSLWTVEHHFTPYILSTDPLQFLTYFAGRTEEMDLGTQVVVLPWHDPIRVAESISMLDNLLQDRKLYVGLGRGTAQLEFDGFRVPRAESRARFAECLEVVRTALTETHFSYEGKYYQIPPIGLRPALRDRSVLDRFYMSWGSPESVPIAAASGLKPLIVPQKDWSRHQAEIEQFNALRVRDGMEAAHPIIMLAVYCAATDEEAEGGQRYIEEWARGATRHYQFETDVQFGSVEGYEYRAHNVELVKNMTREELEAFRQKNAPGHVRGTPSQVFEQLRDKIHAVGAEELTVTMKFGTMPLEMAEKSVRLFAKEVLPALKALPIAEPRVSLVNAG
jgi:alkanesulfonate monooxygenase SsuD/methylene tetrahydromethanopterin reductase-like flavin-dependent oxidoreductase (luciferase family)